jgi:hypothetical protein
MPEYRVVLQHVVQEIFYVEAEDEEDAEVKAVELQYDDVEGKYHEYDLPAIVEPAPQQKTPQPAIENPA